MDDKLNAQKKGVIGEKNLLNILNQLLNKFSSISSLRKYESGYQEGKDIKAEGFFNKKRNEIAQISTHKYKWFFEVKNYKSKLDPYKIVGKISQIKNSQHKIDVFCLFSPHEDISGIWEDNLTSKKLFHLPEYPFAIVLWTPAMNIKNKIKAFPELYEQIFGTKIKINKEKKEEILKEWISEITSQTKEGNKIQKDYISKFQGDKPLWIPDSIKSAKESIKKAKCLPEDNNKSNILNRKLNAGGIKAPSEIMNAKQNRIMSEGIRRKYKKKNKPFYSKLNELRQELYNFCHTLENSVLEKNDKNEAQVFFNEFSSKIKKFKEEYRDSKLIDKLPDFYYKGQMLDITGECLLSLSNKWLNEVKDI